MNAPRFTAADLDALSDLVASAGYRILRARVEAELERRRLELEQPASNADHCRGLVSALRTALAIPGILREEMKHQISKDDDAT